MLLNRAGVEFIARRELADAGFSNGDIETVTMEYSDCWTVEFVYRVVRKRLATIFHNRTRGRTILVVDTKGGNR